MPRRDFLILNKPPSKGKLFFPISFEIFGRAGSEDHFRDTLIPPADLNRLVVLIIAAAAKKERGRAASVRSQAHARGSRRRRASTQIDASSLSPRRWNAIFLNVRRPGEELEACTCRRPVDDGPPREDFHVLAVGVDERAMLPASLANTSAQGAGRSVASLQINNSGVTKSDCAGCVVFARRRGRAGLRLGLTFLPVLPCWQTLRGLARIWGRKSKTFLKLDAPPIYL